MNRQNSEQRILMVSIWGAVVFSVGGVLWGIASHSRMILFDGIYSLISLGLSLGSYWTWRFIRKEEPVSFQFGKESLVPLVVALKALVLLGLSVYAIAAAVTDLRTGGRQVQLGSALGYSLLSTVLCTGIFLLIRRRQRKTQSSLAGAEAAQWLMDSVLSMAVLLGFGAAWALQFTTWAHLMPYVDPVLVLVFGVYFLKVPYGILRDNLPELLMMAPEPDIRQEIDRAVRAVRRQHALTDAYVRTAKIGHKLVIEIDFVVDSQSLVWDIVRCDLVREDLDRQLNGLGYGKWLTVSFTGDRKWAV